MFNTFAFFDKEFKKTPFSVSGSASYGFSEKNSFQENIENTFSNENISGIINIRSKFKQSPLHFGLGYKYSEDTYSNDGNKSKLLVVQPSLNLNGNLTKQLFWNLNSIFTSYSGQNSDRDLFSLSPRIRYSKDKSKWEVYLKGDNILNLNNQTIIENNSTSNFFEQRLTSTLQGYLIFGSKYKF
jgi:hypothetical protein